LALPVRHLSCFLPAPSTHAPLPQQLLDLIDPGKREFLTGRDTAELHLLLSMREESLTRLQTPPRTGHAAFGEMRLGTCQVDHQQHSDKQLLKRSTATGRLAGTARLIASAAAEKRLREVQN